jgi:hypothetical protein
MNNNMDLVTGICKAIVIVCFFVSAILSLYEKNDILFAVYITGANVIMWSK